MNLLDYGSIDLIIFLNPNIKSKNKKEEFFELHLNQIKEYFQIFKITIGMRSLNNLKVEKFLKKIKNKAWSKNCLYW